MTEAKAYISGLILGGRTRRKPAKNWRCQECGKRMTQRAAERMDGCTRCGSSDVDLAGDVRRLLGARTETR